MPRQIVFNSHLKEEDKYGKIIIILTLNIYCSFCGIFLWINDINATLITNSLIQLNKQWNRLKISQRTYVLPCKKITLSTKQCLISPRQNTFKSLKLQRFAQTYYKFKCDSRRLIRGDRNTRLRISSCNVARCHTKFKIYMINLIQVQRTLARPIFRMLFPRQNYRHTRQVYVHAQFDSDGGRERGAIYNPILIRVPHPSELIRHVYRFSPLQNKFVFYKSPINLNSARARKVFLSSFFFFPLYSRKLRHYCISRSTLYCENRKDYSIYAARATCKNMKKMLVGRRAARKKWIVACKGDCNANVNVDLKKWRQLREELGLFEKWCIPLFFNYFRVCEEFWDGWNVVACSDGLSKIIR